MSPRLSLLESGDFSTIRSQDEKLSATWQPQAGHSTTSENHVGVTNKPIPPRARLLKPDFEAEGSVSIIRQPSVSGESVTSQPQQNLTGGHSLGFNASQIRGFLNSQSRNEMTEGNLLSEKDSEWQVLSSSSESTARQRQTNQNSVAPAAAESLAAARPVSDTQEVEAPATDVDVLPEPSVLQRLKGLYGTDGESSARQIWKRQFQRLQSPFSVFRDRDKEPTAIAPPVVTAGSLPEQSELETEVDNQLLLQLIAVTLRELEDWPRLLNGQPRNPESFQRRQQDLQLLYLIANQPGAAMMSLESLPEGEQGFWQEVMLALAHYRSDDGVDPEMRFTMTAGQLQSAVRQLRPLTSLNFKRLDICSRIYSFGRLEAFPTNDFDPGQPILLYAELENVSTELTASGRHRTNFDAQLQILHEDSVEPIETIDLANIADESTSERTDYFQSFELTVPSHLANGRYRIRVRLRDRISRKTAESFVEFQVR